MWPEVTDTAVVKCEGLGKRYALGRSGSYQTLREVLSQAGTNLLRSWRGGADRPPESRELWSLRDVSFEVAPGEVLGIIGRNGAGKSTLLRIIAGITEPTEGWSAVRGRVGSLLEIGTGFHPELTGHENIFLSGAILGMRRREIRRQYDAIVEFAEIAPFLSTPVKRYSSGMYMRLAFAVAAHLRTEVLLVDEVLAVGDAAFQRKCLNAMSELASQRRTILLVSHDLAAVQRLCSRALLLDRGRIAAEGAAEEVIVSYLSDASLQTAPTVDLDLRGMTRRGTGEARFTSLRYAGGPGALGSHPTTGAPLEVEVTIEAATGLTVGCVELMIRDHRGVKLVDVDCSLLGRTFRLERGANSIRFGIERLPLNPGVYYLGLWLARSAQESAGIDHVDPVTEIEVVASDARRLVGYSSAYGPVACSFDVTSPNAPTD